MGETVADACRMDQRRAAEGQSAASSLPCSNAKAGPSTNAERVRFFSRAVALEPRWDTRTRVEPPISFLMLVEGLVQGLAAGAIGLAFAFGGSKTLVGFVPGDVPRLRGESENGRNRTTRRAGSDAGADHWVAVRTRVAVIGIGLAAGLFGAALMTRYLGTLLFEIKPTDPVTDVGCSHEVD